MREIFWRDHIINGYCADDNGIIYDEKNQCAISVSRTRSWNFFPIVYLNTDGKYHKSYRYDYIMGYTFHGYYDDIIRIVYIDGNKTNTHPRNLKWLRLSDIHNKYKQQYHVDDINDIPEEWKDYPVKIYGKQVEVSNLGRVRSIVTLDEINPYKDHDYLIFRASGGTAILVHRMVAELFVENPKPHVYTLINHLDYNKSNNKFYNLEWCNNSMNTEHGYLVTGKCGRYDEEIVHEICRLLEAGASRQEIANATGTDKKYISKIAVGYRHTDISSQYNIPEMKKNLDDIHGRKRIEMLLMKGFGAKEIAEILQINHDMQFITYCYRLKLSLGLR